MVVFYLADAVTIGKKLQIVSCCLPWHVQLLPTLPDPYAANLGSLARQFDRDFNVRSTVGARGRRIVWLWIFV
jgi:hypothetical protein